MTNFVDYPATGAHRLRAAELNAAFADYAPLTALAPYAQLNQVGWERIGPGTIVSAPISAISWTIPVAYDRVRVEWQNALPVSSSQMFFQVSQDSGATYINSAAAYFSNFSGVQGGVAADGSVTAVVGTLTSTANGVHTGYLEIDPTSFQWDAHGDSNSTTLSMINTYGVVAASARLTNVLVAFISTNISSGRFRLLGAKF